MKVKVVGRPVFYFELSKAILQMVLIEASTHYDYKCRQASVQGGFVYGWYQSACFSDDGVAQIRAEWGELDLLLKILELRHFNSVAEHVRQMDKLSSQVHTMMQMINERKQDWVVEFELKG